MSMKIIVSNLPPDTTTEELLAVLIEFGIESKITLNDEGNSDKVIAVLEIPDLERQSADQLAMRISGTQFRGRALKAYVPLFM